MKSVLTAQSPWWYQLKTAPFSWHFSCRCFFPFFSFFLSRQIFSMAAVALLPAHTCAMLQPQGTASSAGGEAPCSPLLLPTFCAPQLVLHLARREQWDLSPISSCHRAGTGRAACAAPSRKPCGVPSPLLQRLRAAAADHLTNFTVRPQLIIIIFLFQSVFQVFLECHK